MPKSSDPLPIGRDRRNSRSIVRRVALCSMVGSLFLTVLSGCSTPSSWRAERAVATHVPA